MRPLAALFLVSGIPALLYQVVWQRALFAVFGTNIESVTVVVAAFMLGLGLGGLAGGRVSRWPTRRLLFAFAAAELAVCALGLVSLPVIHAVGTGIAGIAIWQAGLLAFGLVVLPTTLMGATLPILTAYLVRVQPNVGRVVGRLYFANTLGSAAACFAAGWWIMGALGQQGTVWLAAAFNLCVGSGALLLALTQRREDAAAPSETAATSNKQRLLGRGPAMLLAGLAGFLSLSLEILWIRLYGFASGGWAPVFAFVLGFFLSGIALGSALAAHCAARIAPDDARLGRVLFLLLLAASTAGFLVAPAAAELATWLPYGYGFVLVGTAAALWGAVLPLLSHAAVAPDTGAGEGLGGLYAANIAGSVAGSLLTGFVLMDAWSTLQIALFIGLAGLASAWWARRAMRVAEGSGPAAGAALACAAAMLFSVGPMFDGLYEKLLQKQSYRPSNRFAMLIENRSGVIAITPARAVYGGGIYDGRISVSLEHDVNGINRVFAISAFHHNPRRILMLGLATGAWARVLADHPQLETMQVVEINPGYLEAINRYPEVADLLAHPKVHLAIDDGRRWMRDHRGERFDMIVMNTTWNWRAFTSQLLSAEFLELARGFLAPGGLIYYNATFSPEVHRTAAAAFPHSLRYSSMVLAGDSPIVVDLQNWERVLRAYSMGGKPVIDLDSAAGRQALEQGRARFAEVDRDGADEWDSMETRAHILARTQGARIITDDNMGTEWQHSRGSKAGPGAF